MPTLLNEIKHFFPVCRSRQVSFPVALILAAGLLPAVGCNRGHSADVVATVNGRAIMRKDLDKGYQAQLGDPPQQQQLSQEQADSLRLNVLRALIDQEIVEQRAEKMNLTATNEEVDAKLAEMKAPYTEEQFQERLKASNQTIDDLKHALRQNLTINKLLNKEINSKITVTDADVTNYYNQNKAGFNLRETQYHLAQIQVTGQPAPQPGNLQNSKATNEIDARRKIQALKNRLDSGEDFGTLAMNFSEQPETAPNGGDMGFVGPRPERPEFVPWLSEQIPYFNLRHMIRPGLTGWAQVRYGYGASLAEAREKLEFDLYYIKHMTLGLDLLIMFETVKTILRRQGAQ